MPMPSVVMACSDRDRKTAQEVPVECRCDCVNCVVGNHQGCYYWPTELCCPYPRSAETTTARYKADF